MYRFSEPKSRVSVGLVGREKALHVLQHLTAARGKDCWTPEEHEECCDQLFQQLGKEFCQQQDSEKFKSCDILAQLMSSLYVEEDESPSHPWKEEVRKTLMRILRSKLGQPQREPAIMLASQMVRVFGVPWALSASIPGAPRFLCLLVQLVCIEIRLAMDAGDVAEVEQKHKLLCACFLVLEEAIRRMEDGCDMHCLTSKQVSQLLSAMAGAFGGVINFLDLIDKQYPEKATSAIVYSCIKGLGSWIEEEMIPLAKDVYKILPFLFKVCKKTTKDPIDDASTDENQPDKVEEVLPFLLPGLCRLSAEYEPRQIILHNENLNLLVTYFFNRWSWLVLHEDDNNEAKNQLKTLCDIFIHLVVTEETAAREHPFFQFLHKFVMGALPVIAYTRYYETLSYHMTALGIKLSRHQTTRMALYKDICEKFFTSAIHILKIVHQVHGPESELFIAINILFLPCWKFNADLWASSMQALAGLLPSVDWLGGLIWESGWIQHTINMFRQTGGRVVVCPDLPGAYEQLIVAIATHHPAATASITKDADILKWAKKLEWTKLRHLIQTKRRVADQQKLSDSVKN